MAKKQIWNVSTGILGLASGAAMGPGESLHLSEEDAGNAGVLSWVADGLASWMEPVTPAMVADAALLSAQLETANADLAAANKRIAELEAAAAKK